jgi:hypothetical protein
MFVVVLILLVPIGVGLAQDVPAAEAAVEVATEAAGAGLSALQINPYLMIALPLVITLLRNFSKSFASPIITIAMGVVLAAAVELARQIGVPVPDGGNAFASLAAGIGLIEGLKSVGGNAVRKINASPPK